MNPYEQKQEARRQRLEARAERLRSEGQARIARGRKMAEAIPFGQPILVGHHSEKRDRNYRGRIRGNFEKGFETLKAAGEVAARAASVGEGGISSDDPDAVTKLKEQLAEREFDQGRMVAVNKALRKHDTVSLLNLGFDENTIPHLSSFPSYRLTNNNANIRRIKDRITSLERAATRETTQVERQDGLRIVENAEANRLQLIFPGKPSAEARSILKRCGFRWSPSEGAWQRHLNNGAKQAAEWVLAQIAAL
jgi:hypothetical protein